ncbi:DDE superfamily endonuclease containing protein [Histomonas meleagridis]|uniref:DDE superfamily endonuclease containing protein n=1 Tax=Histomonas meleagridis TaxID=135588 RepID=UPI0035596577|nr:DDE superfamily endonuclease containing protein [Histomonas meleagridis]KAH0801157.1 DDE superfamily endonuclease containing protein [Histomonas meleagridis]
MAFSLEGWENERMKISQEEVDEFANLYLNAIANYKDDDIIDMDETWWNYVSIRYQVLAQRGHGEVNAQLPDEYRKNLSVIVTISSSGKKYPPIFIAQGITNACHEQFGAMKSNLCKYEILHSKKGNTS